MALTWSHRRKLLPNEISYGEPLIVRRRVEGPREPPTGLSSSCWVPGLWATCNKQVLLYLYYWLCRRVALWCGFNRIFRRYSIEAPVSIAVLWRATWCASSFCALEFISDLKLLLHSEMTYWTRINCLYQRVCTKHGCGVMVVNPTSDGADLRSLT